ncbi:MAG: dodecin family protein [Neisseria sp.]|nr:dodecin family protein [Neisseria sp.]
MSIAKVIEINASSPVSFDDAVKKGIAKVGETVNNLQGAWVQEQKVVINGQNIVEYRVNLKVTFLVD